MKPNSFARFSRLDSHAVETLWNHSQRWNQNEFYCFIFSASGISRFADLLFDLDSRNRVAKKGDEIIWNFEWLSYDGR